MMLKFTTKQASLSFFLSFFLLLTACEKEPGIGGTAIITGKILIRDYNGYGDLIKEYYAPQKDVFIIYGDNETVNDATCTHFDGTFQFKNLYPGKYTLYTYTGCNKCEVPLAPVFQTIEIRQAGEKVEIPPWILLR